MADKFFDSTAVTFVDMADSRILDVYIASNHPTVQLCNSNTTPLEYTPDWSKTNLKLEASFYLDSTSITPEKIEWTKRVGTTEDPVGSTATLNVNTNVLAVNPIVTYRCEIEYDKLKAFKEITFTRVDTGLNGSDGTDAPAVLAQYSADGSTSWTSTLNTTTHKYIRHSYDGGKTWSVAIKMVGEDGTSVKILGTATSATQVSGTDYYTLVYSSASITSAELGDSYLYDGDLYVCADSRDGQDYFINVGNIQGPSGNDGKSSYVFIRYATDANGSNMSTSPSGKTYMGVYTSDTNIAPTTANSYIWSKFVGDNAKSIVLSGDSQVFKINQSNAVTPSTITVTAQAFNTTVTNWTYSTNGGQTFLSTMPTGVSRNGNTVTVTGSSITSNSLTIKASDGEIEDVFTVYKAFDGSDGNPGDPGAPAPIAFLTNENVTFSANAQGQITGTTITSNVVAYNGTTKVMPTIGTISGAPTGMTITSSTITASNEVMLTITITNNSTLGSTSSNMGVISIPVTYPVSTVLYLTWSKVNTGATGTPGNPGAPAYTAILTNESHVFAGDISNAIEGSATTQVLAYKGSTAQTVTISSVNGKTAATTDTDTGIAGLKFKCSALSGTSPTITFTCTTSFVSANGTIPIVFTVDGVSFTKIFTYSIAFKGEQGVIGPTGNTGSPGVPATSYWLISSASVVQKTSTGTITVTPSTLTFTGKSQTGTATPTDYACRWIIAYSTDGTNYTNLYTSSSNEASKSITVATTYKTIRVRMYLAGGTSTLLDEQIIPIISDGVKGDTGNGISSVTVTYGTSDSASTQPTSWQATIPTVAEGAYLWTRTITDYTDSSIADTVTYTYAKQGAQGNIGPQGTSVAVSSIQYQAGTSATTAPTGTWLNSVVTVAEGSYLWTKTTFTDGKVAYGVARQGINGDDGRGITSIVEQYYQSTSATTQSGGSWSTTVPTWADGKYIWTRSVITYTDSTTSTTSPVCVTGQKGGIGGTGVGVSSVDVWYYQSTSATSLSGGSWSTTAPTWSDGQYVWTKTITTYTNSTTDETAAVCITGQKGATGVGVKSVTEYYLATSAGSGVAVGTPGWTTTVQTITLDNKYLWNYEVITYTNNTTSTTTPIIIGVYGNTGNTGKGIKSVTEYYLATASSSGVTTSTTGWTTTMQTLTDTNKYLWNYELITYTDNTTATISPVIIGVYGDKGTDASLVDVTPSAYYFKSTTGKNGTFTPEYIYLYPRFQTVTFNKWEYSINGGTTWVAASGANGISIGTYNSIANTLRIARTSTLYTDTVTSISFRCVSSNASVYDTVSIGKIYDVVDLQIGGRNLAEKTNQGITNWLWSMQTGDYTKEEYVDSNQVKCCKFTKGTTTTQTGWSVIEYTNIGLLKYEPNQTYTISFDVLSSVTTTISVRLLKPDGTNDLASVYTPINKQLTANVWSKIVYTTTTLATLPTLTDQCLYITGMSSSNGVSYIFKNVKIEKGNKATDWTPAPEDVLEYATNTSVMLSNEAHFFEADSQGVPTETSITLDVIGYQGSIQSVTTVGTITGLPAAGMTATILNNGATNTQIRIAVTKDLTSVDSGVLTIPVTVNGKVVNKIFSWTKSKEGLMGERGSDAISFQVYSEHGYVLSKDTPSITLQTFAYNGDVPIEAGATYQWYKYTSGNWTAITDATNGYLNITHSDVSFSGSYMCKMLFNNIEYVGVATIDDKNDTNKIFTSKPSSYAAGDIWIVGGDYAPSGVITGTVLKAEYPSNTYKDQDWVIGTKYDKALEDINKHITTYNQYFDFDDEEGLRITARDKNNVESKFSTTLTNEQLAFNYGDEAIAYINGTSMHIKEAEIESPLTVTGKYSNGAMLQAPIINIGNFSIVVESNGSLSIVSNI